MKRVVGVAAAVLSLAAALFFWSGSDRRRIEKALDRFEGACGKSGPDSPLSLLDRNQTIVGTFAPGFLVAAEPYQGSFTDAQELARAIHFYRASATSVTVSDSKRRIEVRKDGTAEMETLFRVAGETGSGPGVEQFRASVFWVKHEGDWKIRELRVVEVVERSGLF